MVIPFLRKASKEIPKSLCNCLSHLLFSCAMKLAKVRSILCRFQQISEWTKILKFFYNFSTILNYECARVRVVPFRSLPPSPSLSFSFSNGMRLTNWQFEFLNCQRLLPVDSSCQKMPRQAVANPIQSAQVSMVGIGVAGAHI